jgi:protein-tyrosine phosphatase
MKTNYHDYARIHTVGAEDTRQVLKVFFDSASYPIDFHCIGGADRTGTVATLLHGILGLEDDEIWKDYQITAWQGGINDAKHLRWFTAFIESINKRYDGNSLAERIQKYVLWLGFTNEDMERFRDLMFEDL